MACLEGGRVEAELLEGIGARSLQPIQSSQLIVKFDLKAARLTSCKLSLVLTQVDILLLRCYSLG